MSLSTLERQRLRAALNNIELANRIETMLNFVDSKSAPEGVHQFMIPKSDLAIDGYIELPPFTVVGGAAISIDIPASAGIVSQSAVTYTLQSDVHGSGVGLNTGTGLITGTAPAHDSVDEFNNFYNHMFSCQSPYGVLTIGINILILAA